jgi:hypothetical protein
MAWPRPLAPIVLLAAACSQFGAVYPPRPPASPAAPVADPTPSRIVAHVTVTGAALGAALEDAVPTAGDGDFALLGSQRHYAWERGPLDLRFGQGRMVLRAHVVSKVAMPVTNLELPLDLRVEAEPVVNSAYAVKLQSTDVKVTSTDRRLKLLDSLAGVLETIGAQVDAKLREFSYDLHPTLEEAYARVAKPIDLPLGDAAGGATGCAELRVLGVEAGPTVIADGIEKDIGLVVAPSITLPCASGGATPLPALQNVATITPGPFTVTVPIAARYDELTRAMGGAFTDGKLFFSTEHPKLYLEKPELYESQGVLVLKLHVAGSVHELGIDSDIDGDLYLSGHLLVVDNQLMIPDLEPTIETKNFLLSLKAMMDGSRIRDEARAALRLDIGERLSAVRAKLGSDLTFGTTEACFKGDVDKIEVTGAYAHGTYARVYVAVTARAAITAPCPGGETKTQAR